MSETMQQRIDKIEAYIKAHKHEVQGSAMRQSWHFMPPVGWMNDPNGLIYFRRQYHVFYQFNPYDGFWGMMHWGHAVSDDLVHWEYLPVALAPDQTYDEHPKGGCFSGSAIEHDGKLFLIYTGTFNEGNGFEQVQCVAWSEDGIHFKKYGGNPVITAPEGYEPANFRDPKVFKHGDTFYVVVGAKRNGFAQALLYKSEDMLHWSFVNVLAESRGELGYMWECPDFFVVDDEKYVLCFSPMGLGERKTVYLIGDMDFKTGTFSHNVSGEIDWGFDYYAPQSFMDHKGRRLMIAWANAWDWMPWWKDWGPTYKDGWCGALSVPREVKLLPNGTLSFVPVEEINSLHRNERNLGDIEVVGNGVQIGNGCAFDLQFEIDLEKTVGQVELSLRSGNGRAVQVVFDTDRALLQLDRNNADGWSKGRTKSPMPLKGRKHLDVRILGDTDSIELFAAGGTINHSINVFAPAEQDAISVSGNTILRNVRLWEISRVSR